MDKDVITIYVDGGVVTGVVTQQPACYRVVDNDLDEEDKERISNIVLDTSRTKEAE